MSDPAVRLAFRGAVGSFAMDVAFTAPARGITAVFGPSGCGKTTLLRCAAGLQRMPDGFCAVGATVWQQGEVFVPPHRRAVGYVFQDANLFAHLSVRRNLLFATGRGRPAAWDETVALLGLEPLLDRAPSTLSGGERQRVAIGRALLSKPAVLLMDEPLSALHRAARHEILAHLETLGRTAAVPILYVTHEMGEVERLAHHLVLMDKGRVQAAGPLAALQSDPALPLAAARDAAVSLEAVVTGYDPAFGLATLDVSGATLLVPTPALPPGAARRLRIAAGDVSLARDPPDRSTILNLLPAVIHTAVATGPHEITAVLLLGGSDAGARILSRVTRRSWETLALAPGQRVTAQVKAIALEGRS